MNNSELKRRAQELIQEAREETKPHFADDEWQIIALALAAKMAHWEWAIGKRIQKMRELAEGEVR